MARHSLKSKIMIRSILNTGKHVSTDQLAIYYGGKLPGMEDDYTGAFLVPKTAGNAVQRNRIKRWLREDFRRLQDKDKICGGFVFKFKGTAEETEHGRLSQEIEKLYNTIKVDA